MCVAVEDLHNYLRVLQLVGPYIIDIKHPRFVQLSSSLLYITLLISLMMVDCIIVMAMTLNVDMYSRMTGQIELMSVNY